MLSIVRPIARNAIIQASAVSLPINRIATRLLQRRQSATLPRPHSRSISPKAAISVDHGIPRLAWLCHRSDSNFRFVCGSSVENLADGIFEGVWDGSFTDIGDIASRQHFGSGALFGERILFMPPKHLAEHIYILRNGKTGEDWISNSLCFCLSAAAAPESLMAKLDAELISDTHHATWLGAYLSKPLILREGQLALYRMMYQNFTMDAAGGICLEQPYHGHRFRSYREYRSHLASTLYRLFLNGKAPARKTKLDPLTSVSRGYDSTAVAALAAEQGCKEAVTLSVTVDGVDDCGSEIARGLNLDVREFPHALGPTINSLRTTFDPRISERALEFIATAGIGDDITFLGFEPALADRVFLTGTWGDSIWAKESTVPPGLPIRIRFGKSLTEFRLRVGFAHVPVPTIGGIFPKSIIAISKSREMAPHSIGGDYDRPIPRRIAEEAGVPRMSFGMAKRATSPDPINRDLLWREAMARTMQRYASAGDL